MSATLAPTTALGGQPFLGLPAWCGATETLTEPIDMKKPKVAADEAMYWPRVAMVPRGPGPRLQEC